MFLNRLDKNERQPFLTLAHHIAQSDLEFASNERAIVAQYCVEMQTPDVDYDKDTFNLTEVLDQITPEHSNIVLLELTALAQADGAISTQEAEILDEMAQRFNTNPHLLLVFKEWTKNMISLYLQGDALIHL